MFRNYILDRLLWSSSLVCKKGFSAVIDTCYPNQKSNVLSFKLNLNRTVFKSVCNALTVAIATIQCFLKTL